MLLRDFIKICETGYNSILITDSGNGYYFENMESIPEELQSREIVSFDSGFGYDAANGLLFGLSIVLRFPEEGR